MDCSPPGSSVCGILQAGILEWVAMPSSRGSSRPRGRTQVSLIAGRFFTIWASKVMVNHDLPDAWCVTTTDLKFGFRKREHHGVIIVQNIAFWGRHFLLQRKKSSIKKKKKQLMKKEWKDVKFYHFLNMLYIFHYVKTQKLELRMSSTWASFLCFHYFCLKKKRGTFWII